MSALKQIYVVMKIEQEMISDSFLYRCLGILDRINLFNFDLS